MSIALVDARWLHCPNACCYGAFAVRRRILRARLGTEPKRSLQSFAAAKLPHRRQAASALCAITQAPKGCPPECPLPQRVLGAFGLEEKVRNPPLVSGGANRPKPDLGRDYQLCDAASPKRSSMTWCSIRWEAKGPLSGQNRHRHALPSMPMRPVMSTHSARMRVIRSWVARTRASLG